MKNIDEIKVADKLVKSKVCKDIKDALKQLPNNDSRKRVKKLLRELTQHTEHVYQLPVEERENYWKASFNLYNFLRQAGQLERTVFGFSNDVKKALKKILATES